MAHREAKSSDIVAGLVLFRISPKISRVGLLDGIIMALEHNIIFISLSPLTSLIAINLILCGATRESGFEVL